MYKTGFIYHFKPCRASIPEKNKYAICVSGRNEWFFLINSCSDIRPYKHEIGKVVVLNSFQVEPLRKQSYINVMKLIKISNFDYDECQEYEKVSNKVWLEIKGLCNKVMAKKYSEIIASEKL